MSWQGKTGEDYLLQGGKRTLIIIENTKKQHKSQGADNTK